jgi:hypothetical protein
MFQPGMSTPARTWHPAVAAYSSKSELRDPKFETNSKHESPNDPNASTKRQRLF